MTIDWTKFVDVVEVNPTELCNLLCDFCPRAHGYPNRNLHMDAGIAGMIREGLLDIGFTGIVSITGKGEPTLAKNFVQIAEIFLGQPWKVKINTNGKRLDKYIDIISRFDMVYYDYYDEDWKGFLDTIEKYKKYPNFKFWYKPPLSWTEYQRSYTNRAGSMEGEYSFDLRNKPYQKYCGRPVRKMFIDWNGDYRLCCEDWRVGNQFSIQENFHEYEMNKTETTLDNILHTPIDEYLLTNKTLARYRDKLLRGDRSESPCNMCSFKNDDDAEHFLRVLDEYQQHDIQSDSDNERGDRIPLRTIF